MKRIVMLALAFVMCLGVAAPARAAAAKTDIMPREIMTALACKQMRVQAGVIGLGDVSRATYEVLNEIALPASLNIDIINIDMDKVHQTYPIMDSQIHFLKERGYSDEEIAELDMGDFFNIEASLTINPNIIKYIKKLYPELSNVDVSKWTYADWNKYYTTEDAKKYAPTETEAEALAKRNIRLEDAQKLLHDYYDYETILAQSDEQLAEDIKAYYQFTIYNISEMAKY